MKANGCVVVFCLSFRRERRAVEGGVAQCCDWSDALGGRQTPTEHGEVFFFFPSGRHVVSVTLLFFI